MKKIKENDIENIKKRLRSYTQKQIEFNNPHFKFQLLSRDGKLDDVIENLLNPEKLIYYYKEKGNLGDIIYVLLFKISNTRTLKLPVIFNKKNKKSIYVLTYILTYRRWQSLIKKDRLHGHG